MILEKIFEISLVIFVVGVILLISSPLIKILEFKNILLLLSGASLIAYISIVLGEFRK